MAPSTQAHIDQIDTSLYLVTLPILLPGFDGFIGCWVYTGSLTVLVDPGPAASAPALFSALSELGLQQPDLILLTHIHIDHAGAAGAVARQWPKTAIVCHPKAVKHLVDPEQLWQGTVKILGQKVAKGYAPFEAVPSKLLLSADHLRTSQIAALDTPGHAAHHCAYTIDNDVLFAGEAAGICLPVENGAMILRPATPPRFFMDTYLQSLDRVMALSFQRICYGHLSCRNQSENLLEAHRNQIEDWRQWLMPWFVSSPDDSESVMVACIDDLLARDPLLADFGTLPMDIQAREKGFMRNSINGYWGYLAGLKSPGHPLSS